jgi:hypothetical protein
MSSPRRASSNYDAPIARYWPEFGVSGKEEATVRHALTHAVGVAKLPPDVTAADLCDWDGMCSFIAAQAPQWRPGTATGYHGSTYGYILGEIVRRVTTQPRRPGRLQGRSGVPAGLVKDGQQLMGRSIGFDRRRLVQTAGTVDVDDQRRRRQVRGVAGGVVGGAQGAGLFPVEEATDRPAPPGRPGAGMRRPRR